MYEKSIAELSSGLRAGEFSSVELTQAYLDRIAQCNGELNSFITVCGESALVEAKAADEAIELLEALEMSRELETARSIRQRAASRIKVV